jgi:hypothetical protein
MPGDKELMDTMLTASSLTTWTIMLLILDIILLRRMRGIGIEEIRIV